MRQDKRQILNVDLIKYLYLFGERIRPYFLGADNITRAAVSSDSEEELSVYIHIISLDTKLVIPWTENHAAVSVPHLLEVLIEQERILVINLKLYGQSCVGCDFHFISQLSPSNLGRSNEGVRVLACVEV